MITCQKDNTAVLEVEDLYARLLSFRIFRISDQKTEPKPIYGSSEWIMSTKLFPARFVKVKNVYDSDFVKVKLYHDKQTQETVIIKRLLQLLLCFRSQLNLLKNLKLVQMKNYDYGRTESVVNCLS